MKKIVALSAALALSMGLTGAAAPVYATTTETTAAATEATATGSTGSGAKLTINIGHGGAESTAQQVGCLELKNYLETNSDGNVTVNIYPNNSMGNDDELCQMVQNGNLEMCLANSIIVNYVPDAVIYDLFYNFNNIDDVKAKFMEDENFLNVMRTKYDEAGFYLGGFSVHGFRVTTANKAIKSPDDLKGLTFRVMQNDLHIQAWQAMGATPTPFSFSELYTALQQGTIDAQENPIELIYSQKFYEQQKFITKTNHLQQTQQWLVGKDYYDALDPADQQLLNEAIQSACVAATDYALNNEAQWSSEIEATGTQIVDLTDEERNVFKEAVKPEWDTVQGKVSPEVWEAYTK